MAASAQYLSHGDDGMVEASLLLCFARPVHPHRAPVVPRIVPSCLMWPRHVIVSSEDRCHGEALALKSWTWHASCFGPL